jgi:hypothetical protein
MANFELLSLVGGKQKRQNSNALSIDFTAVAVGADALAIQQGGSGAGAYFDFGARNMRSSATPVNANDLVNKAYADNLAAGLKWKSSVKALADSDITLSGEQTIDGIALVSGNRVAVIGQSTASENGIYVVDSGAWSRSSDADQGVELVSAAFFIEEGTSYGDSAWVCVTNSPITLGSTALAFNQFAGGGAVIGGAGLLKTGNTLDIQAADNSMTINADSIEVKINASGAIEVSPSGLAVKIEATNPSLQISSNELGVKLDASGAITTGASGIKVALESSNPSLEVASNELGVKLNASGAIEKGASGIAVKLEASNPSLEIASNELGLKVSASGAIEKGASGVAVKLEASTPSLEIVSNELGLKVDAAGAIAKGASGVSVQVQSGSLKIASNMIAVDHAVSAQNDNASTVAANKAVFIKTNGNFDLATKVTASDSVALAFTEESIASSASGKIVVRRGAIISGFTSLTPGEKYFVNTSGDVAKYTDISFSAGDFVYSVGRALSATEILFDPEYEFEF